MLRFSYRLHFAAILIAALTGCAATPGKISHAHEVSVWNADHGIAIKGYDPTAYFDLERPVKGDRAIAYQWQGVTWLFSSMERRDLFMADPDRYAPQFGSYCSFAVSRGTIADIDPKRWAVVEGKLYLNNNLFAHSLWEQDRERNIEAGKINWLLLKKPAADSP